jgi:hypothetical protein
MAEFITKSLTECAEQNKMIGYKTFEKIWDEVHKDKEKTTDSPILEEVTINVADDVLNSDGCVTKQEVEVDNFFITEDTIEEERM